MKAQVTKKFIRSNYRCIAIGYCNAYYLLRGLYPAYYTAGVYGWNADIYTINTNVAIVTGYRPFGTRLDYAIVDSLERQAKKALEDGDLETLERVRNKFMALCIKAAK